MSDWLENLPGIKDVIDATGAEPVVVARYSKLQIEGAAEVIPDSVNKVTRLRIGGGDTLTFVESDVAYEASFGEHVLLGSNDPMPSLTFPLAADRPNGRVGVTATSAGGNPLLTSGDDNISGAIEQVTVGQMYIFQSNGVSTWYVVGFYPGPGA